MSQDEFNRWKAFYLLNPFDDLHRYHRPAALVSSSIGGDFRERLEVLCRPIQGEHESADEATLRAFGLGRIYKER
ncbi:hypothetical protein CS343_15145 [Bordetella bronchiseptica]|nr:hypothetical protein CS343_15145 [Bordetella bronchiseptica]